MTVRTDDGRSVAFDLKDYDRIDHGYAATIHKAQGMTVDRTHVLATPGMDAHGSYVALSRHRDGMDLHYGRDDFATQDRLVRTLSRDRAKDMASDYEPAIRRRTMPSGAASPSASGGAVAEIVRKQVPEKVRGMFDGLRLPADGAPGADAGAAGRGRADADGAQREPASPARRMPMTRNWRCAAPGPLRSSAMPAPWTRSSSAEERAARPAPSRCVN